MVLIASLSLTVFFESILECRLPNIENKVNLSTPLLTSQPPYFQIPTSRKAGDVGILLFILSECHNPILMI